MLAFLSFRAGVRTVDLGAKRLLRGGQSLNLSSKAAVFKRESLLNGGGASMSIGGARPPLAPGLISLDSDEQY